VASRAPLVASLLLASTTSRPPLRLQDTRC